MHVHIVPVDPSLTPDEAWDEILDHGHRVTYSAIADDGDFVTDWTTLRCERPDCVDRA